MTPDLSLRRPVPKYVKELAGNCGNTCSLRHCEEDAVRRGNLTASELRDCFAAHAMTSKEVIASSRRKRGDLALQRLATA